MNTFEKIIILSAAQLHTFHEDETPGSVEVLEYIKHDAPKLTARPLMCTAAPIL